MPARDRRRPRPGDRPLTAHLAPSLLAGALVCAGPLPAQDEPEETPPRRADQVTVTATRGDARVADTPASVAVVPRAALDATAAPAVDDALRQVVGFSLFRRSGSRAANPTAQGVSLRGLGASGASRALVLADGLPLNDPFGGWVYWARVPRLAIERLEVLRGGASDLYGSGALGGVVQIVTRPPSAGRGARGRGERRRRLHPRRGAERAGQPRRLVGAALGPGLPHRRLRASGRVAPRAVDTEAASRHAAVDATVERRAFGDGRVFARGMAYGEDRENGTPLQVNDTHIGLAALGLDWGAPERAPRRGASLGRDAGLPPGLHRGRF